MAGTAKTSKLSRVAAPVPDPAAPNFFVTGLTLHDAVYIGGYQPPEMNVVFHKWHAFSNKGGADGRVPSQTIVKIYETLMEVKRNSGTICSTHLINGNTNTLHHTFNSGQRPVGTGDLWHWVHDPPIEFTVPANHLLITRGWINGSFHRLAVLHIGTRS